MTIDTVCAANVKIETKQGLPAVQQQLLAAGKNAAGLGASQLNEADRHVTPIHIGCAFAQVPTKISHSGFDAVQ
jgi:hypothetical protein